MATLLKFRIQLSYKAFSMEICILIQFRLKFNTFLKVWGVSGDTLQTALAMCMDVFGAIGTVGGIVEYAIVIGKQNYIYKKAKSVKRNI